MEVTLTDIVERLRGHPGPDDTVTVQFRTMIEQRHEAATEIERLRALAPIVREQGFEIERLQKAWEHQCQFRRDLHADIERLLAALEEIANMGTGERVRIARRALEQKP